MPDYVLLGLLGVWIPMFTIGFFMWSMPPRYTVASLLPMLLCAFAFAQKCTDWLQLKMSVRTEQPLQIGAAAAIMLLVGQSTGGGRDGQFRL